MAAGFEPGPGPGSLNAPQAAPRSARRWLRLMGCAVALLALSACGRSQPRSAPRPLPADSMEMLERALSQVRPAFETHADALASGIYQGSAVLAYEPDLPGRPVEAAEPVASAGDAGAGMPDEPIVARGDAGAGKPDVLVIATGDAGAEILDEPVVATGDTGAETPDAPVIAAGDSGAGIPDESAESDPTMSHVGAVGDDEAARQATLEEPRGVHQPIRSSVDSDRPPPAWVIQIAALGDERDAARAAAIAQLAFPQYSARVEPHAGVYRVVMEGWATQAEAREAAATIESRYPDAWVRRYDPDQ